MGDAVEEDDPQPAAATQQLAPEARPPDLGILVVHGIGNHKQGETLNDFAAPIIKWIASGTIFRNPLRSSAVASCLTFWCVVASARAAPRDAGQPSSTPSTGGGRAGGCEPRADQHPGEGLVAGIDRDARSKRMVTTTRRKAFWAKRNPQDHACVAHWLSCLDAGETGYARAPARQGDERGARGA